VLAGNTTALAKTSRPRTASGGAYVGSFVDPGMYGGIRPRLNKNQAADHAMIMVASTV
jgi:hypothetical protein